MQPHDAALLRNCWLGGLRFSEALVAVRCDPLEAQAEWLVLEHRLLSAQLKFEKYGERK